MKLQIQCAKESKSDQAIADMFPILGTPANLLTRWRKCYFHENNKWYNLYSRSAQDTKNDEDKEKEDNTNSIVALYVKSKDLIEPVLSQFIVVTEDGDNMKAALLDRSSDDIAVIFDTCLNAISCPDDEKV